MCTMGAVATKLATFIGRFSAIELGEAHTISDLSTSGTDDGQKTYAEVAHTKARETRSQGGLKYGDCCRA